MIYDLQKASLLKRISAFLLDLVTILILFTGFMIPTSLIVGYDGYINGLETRLTEIQESHSIDELEKKYGTTFNEYQYMLPEEREKLPEELRASYDACNKQMNEDSEVIKLYEMVMSLSLIIVSIPLLLAFLVVEFLIPILFKNGQTLGKKIFSISVMRVDGVRISTKVLFIRTVLGKYTIGTMVPLLMLLSLTFGLAPLIPLTVVLAILLIQVVMMVTTKTNSLIHDTLSSTVVVDSLSQMIFDSIEAKNEYVLNAHRDDANIADY